MRIYSEPDHGELLMELRVSRGSRVVPGCQVLVVEWLLLQNPRAHFGPYRRPLPGQKHPGLGLLKEVFGWLVAMAEILELDGIYYVPSSYHVAIQSRRRVRFLEPEDEALIQSLEELFDRCPAVRGQQYDRRWAGGGRGDRRIVRVAGLSDGASGVGRTRERVCGEVYDERVAAEKKRLRLALIQPVG